MTSTADADRDVGCNDGDQIARAVAAVRRAAVTMVSAGRGPADFSEIAHRIHALADDLEVRAASVHDRMMAMEREGRGARYSPVVGAHNGIAPPVDLRETAFGTEGSVTFSRAYERTPGVVDEGAVAMILDVALANANSAAGVAGMTAQLNIRFHSLLPSGKELAIRSWHDRVDGRKAYSSAEIWLGDRLVVTADGLFISSRNRMTDA